MALRYVLLSAVLVASAMATFRQMDLSGVIDPRAGPCLGQECPPPPPLVGPNATIWHCNGTCTLLFLRCKPGGFELSIQPPAGQTTIHAHMLGGPGHTGGPYDIKGCDSAIWGPPEISSAQPRDPFAAPVHHTVSYDRCGTTDGPSSDPNNPTCREYFNEIDLVEFLLVRKHTDPDPAVHIVSHTQINLKCCNCGGTDTALCPPPTPPRRELSDCTNKTFELTCNSNVDNESYCCGLQLAGTETLPAGVDFYPERCYGVDSDTANGGTGAEVDLFPINQNLLQVDVARNSPRTSYSFGGPWFQFDRDPELIDPPHRVEVRCTVKLADSKDVLDRYPNPGPGCHAPSRPRSDAGFFQAGQLTLIK